MALSLHPVSLCPYLSLTYCEALSLDTKTLFITVMTSVDLVIMNLKVQIK